MKKPIEPGYWWATGLEGRKLLVVDTDKERGGLLARLADAIHWPEPSKENPTGTLWFKPNSRWWTNWKQVKPE